MTPLSYFLLSLFLCRLVFYTGRHCDICVIIEYCPYGNMLQFLRNKRGIYDSTWLPPSDNPDKQFTMTDVVSAAFQVARGMEFLASRKVSTRKTQCAHALSMHLVFSFCTE